MSSLLWVVLPLSISASLIFLEVMVIERILKGEYHHLLFACMKIVTGFFLLPAFALACVVFGLTLTREVVRVNLDDVKWIIKGEIFFSDFQRIKSLLMNISFLWLCGVCTFLFLQFIRTGYLLKRLLSKCTLAGKREAAWKNKLLFQYKINKSVELLKSREISSPFLTGILRPKIVIPDRHFSDKEVEMILTHELTHLRNQDVLFKSFASVVQCFHWFNPIVYLYLNKVYEYCEYACDESVIKICNKAELEQYARLIISLAGKKRVYEPSMPLISSEIKVMKRRIFHIMKHEKKKQSRKVAAAVAAILAMCPVTVYASAYGVVKSQSELAAAYNNSYFAVKDWGKLDGEAVKVDMAENAEKAIRMVTRGTNEIDETVSAGKMIKLIFPSLSKGQLMRVYLTADSSSDQFSITITDSSGKGKRYTSQNGDIYVTYTVPVSGSYSIFISETGGQNDVHVTGTVKIE